jgi:hypothetical protein
MAVFVLLNDLIDGSTLCFCFSDADESNLPLWWMLSDCASVRQKVFAGSTEAMMDVYAKDGGHGKKIDGNDVDGGKEIGAIACCEEPLYIARRACLHAATAFEL